jgi:hypothetical protein
MRKKTKRQIREAVIEEFYSKENGIVYWNYRFNGGNWNKEKTAFLELPWVKIKFNQPPKAVDK